jgi:hypothetical protein
VVAFSVDFNEVTQMTFEAILASVKIACRVSSTTTDSELTELINSAFYDLEISGVADDTDTPYTPETADGLVLTAVKTYVKLHFGDLLSDHEWTRLKASYDEQKAQLKMRRHSAPGIEPGPGPGPTPTDVYVKRVEMIPITDEELEEYWAEAGGES